MTNIFALTNLIDGARIYLEMRTVSAIESVRYPGSERLVWLHAQGTHHRVRMSSIAFDRLLEAFSAAKDDGIEDT